jgi:hypothetical protein
MARRIIEKFANYDDFWNEYRSNFIDDNIDPIARAAHIVITRDTYYHYREREYSHSENDFYGQLFSKINAEAITYAKSQQIFTNLIESLKIKDKELFTIEKRIDRSKENEQISEKPQTTSYVNIPIGATAQGEVMTSNDAYGKARLLKQQKLESKFVKEIIKGKKVQNEDGTISYKDTYEIENLKGEKMWLGKLLSALQHIKYDIYAIVKSFSNLFDNYCRPPSGYFLTLPNGTRRWMVQKIEEIEEDDEEENLPARPKKRMTDSDEISWEEWVTICQKNDVIPDDDNFYLEQITRYCKRKEKELKKLGNSLSAAKAEKQLELAQGLVKAWEKPLVASDLTKFEEVMGDVVSYEEFKDTMRIFIINLAEDIEQGKKTEQTINVLLGPPGIGKSYIAEKLAEAMGIAFVDISLGGRNDTSILEGLSPSTVAAYAGKICQVISDSKSRMVIIILDEFEKVNNEGLKNMIGNILDIKKNKDWYVSILRLSCAFISLYYYLHC